MEVDMSLWIILLIAALVAAAIGFGTAAYWLFIIAVVLLIVGLIGIFAGNRRTL
jgi:general stress protein CsbA